MANNTKLNSDSTILIKPVKKTKKPSDFNVILLNDDFTPMDFVIDILMRFFQKTEDEAYSIMMEVHKKDKGIAGTFCKEIAEAKKQQVIEMATANDFPLHCSIEPSTK